MSLFISQENFVALCELQRDLIGFDSLVQPDREFVRQGCLLKHSRKGYQQRMFFLVSRHSVYVVKLTAPICDSPVTSVCTTAATVALVFS